MATSSKPHKSMPAQGTQLKLMAESVFELLGALHNDEEEDILLEEECMFMCAESVFFTEISDESSEDSESDERAPCFDQELRKVRENIFSAGEIVKLKNKETKISKAKLREKREKAFAQKIMKEGTLVEKIKYFGINIRLDEIGFKSSFKCSRSTIECLIQTVSPAMTNKLVSSAGRPLIPIEKHVLVTVWFLNTMDSLRSIGDRFDLGTSSTVAVTRRVMDAMISNAPQLLSWPKATDTERCRRTRESYLKDSGLPDLLGAIDTIPIRLKCLLDTPPEPLPPKKGVVGYQTVILQAACDYNMNFLDCHVGLLGVTSNIGVYEGSDLCKRIRAQGESMFPDGCYMVASKGYPIGKHLLTPYRSPADPAEKLFNEKLTIALKTIRTAFAHLRGRCKRLNCLIVGRIDLMPNILKSCCILHNYCMLLGDVLPEDDLPALEKFTYLRTHYELNEALADPEALEKRNRIASLLFENETGDSS